MTRGYMFLSLLALTICLKVSNRNVSELHYVTRPLFLVKY